jgi:hypothetical protein
MRRAAFLMLALAAAADAADGADDAGNASRWPSRRSA